MDSDDIGKTFNSVGLELYFLLLVWLGRCFGALTLLTFPLLICCLSTAESNLSAFTIAGLASDDGEGRSRYNFLASSIDAKAGTVLFAVLDALGALLFLAVIVHFRFRTVPQIVQQTDMRTVGQTHVLRGL